MVTVPSGVDGAGWYRLLFPARALARRRGWLWWNAPYVAARNPHAGRGGVRLAIHYGRWEQDGRGVRLVEDLFSWLRRAEFDVLVMQPRDEPDWPDVIGELRAQGKRVLVDVDDVWFGLPPWNPGSGKPAAAVEAMEANIRAADAVSVSTPALAKIVQGLNANVRVIRNRLDWGMWADTPPVYERPSRRLRVGWVGSAHWRKGDLRVLQGVLGPWLEQHPDVEFVAAGDPSVHDILRVPDGQRVSVAETEFQNMDLADIVATMDVGVVPLDLSDEKARRLNECKSHLKGMEYNACGIPFVASPTESYRWWTARGLGGLLAGTPGQWRAGLDTLTDDAVRVAMGKQGRRAAEGFSIQEGVDEWADWVGGGFDRDAAVAALAA